MLRSADVETDGREEEMRVSDRRAADGVSKESTIYAEEWWTMGVLQQPGSVLAQVKLNRLIEEPGVLVFFAEGLLRAIYYEVYHYLVDIRIGFLEYTCSYRMGSPECTKFFYTVTRFT